MNDLVTCKECLQVAGRFSFHFAIMKNNYKVSSDGINLLVEFEGEVLKVYKDPIGLPTLGVGHLVTPNEKKDYPVGKKITRAESRQFLRRDLARFEDCVNSSVKVPITQNQFDALVSLAFNIGEGAFKRSSVLRNLNARKFDAAADSFRAWNKAGGKTLPGLTRRRATERSVFLTPDESAETQSTNLSESPSIVKLQDESAGATNVGNLLSNELPPNSDSVVIEKEDLPPIENSYVKRKWKQITAWWGGIGGLSVVKENTDTVSQMTGGWRPDPVIIGWVIVGVIALFFIWFFGGWIVEKVIKPLLSRWLTISLVKANTTPTNTVDVALPDHLAALEKQGYTIVRRS